MHDLTRLRDALAETLAYQCPAAQCSTSYGMDADTDDLVDALVTTIQDQYVPPPPGSDAEQLPATILARISVLPYLSTACQAAVLLDDASITDLTVDPELAAWADRMHARCRINNELTGQPCICQHHDQEAPDA